MAKQYAAIITSKGQALIAAAIKGGTTVSITEIAVGDGSGNTPVPSVGQTALVNETARVKINSLTVDDGNANHVIADGVIPAETGGFWLREVGLFTEDGILLAISALPPTYKPSAEEGATNSQRIIVTLIVSDTSAVNITVDNTTVMASESYVDDKIAAHEKSRNHPDATLKAKGFVQLSSAIGSTSEILAATPKAVKAANDNAESRLKTDNNLSDLPSASTAKENLKLDKVGNYAAVQQGGGTGMVNNKVYVGWDGEKLIAQVDSTAMGELFYESNPPTASQTGALPTTGGDLSGDVTTSAEIRCTGQNNFRMVNGDYGIFWRQDGNDLYLMLTNAGDQYGGYNDFRPIRVNLSTGLTYINDARPYSANNCPFPVGYIMLMGVGANPNDTYPGTTWQDLTTTYGGRNLQFGYDGLGTGGNNSVTIGANNLPDHSHKSGWGAPGAVYASDLKTGTDNTSTYGRSYTTETFTDGANGANVQNTPIDVTNAYVHIMGWMRTA